jgi:hypothetical protein
MRRFFDRRTLRGRTAYRGGDLAALTKPFAAGQVATDDSLRQAVPDNRLQMRQAGPDLLDASLAFGANDLTNSAAVRRALAPRLSLRTASDTGWHDLAPAGWLTLRAADARLPGIGEVERPGDDRADPFAGRFEDVDMAFEELTPCLAGFEVRWR